MEPILERHSRPCEDNEYSKAIPVNCAGTTGEIGCLPTSLRQIQTDVDLNFSSKAWLTANFVQRFALATTTVIINVSTMCAVKPTPTMALYCATSAARDMFPTVVAMDHTNISSL
mmetsp:Transcript_1780/g.3912  ORF Transcript_1780/g.3912 Transcript_1780/m.3912 type:complete len:115 (-) Transcript_1780:174-518(-)